VSSLTLDCWGGVRKETSGLGASRTLYFGRSGGIDPGSQFIGDFQTGHWNPPEAGQGNWQGYHLCKVTDFYTTPNPPANVPFDFQHYYQDYPWRVWDGAGHITQLTMVQGSFGLDGAGHIGEVWHRDDDTKRTYNWTDPGLSAARDTLRIPNTYNHWLFSSRDERNLTTTYRRDARRRITDITYHNGSSEHFTYNDLFNEVETHTLASGTVLHYQYDPTRGLLLQEWNDTDGPQNATTYTYDSLDRIATVSHAWSRAKGAAFSVSMTYNGRHQVVREEYPATNGGANPFKTYEYDAYGNCLAITDELNHRSTYTYDFYRRCTSYTESLNAPDWNGGPTVASRRWDWLYDRVIDGVGARDASTHTKNEWRVQVEPAFNAGCDRRTTLRVHDLQNRVISEETGWIQPCNSQVGIGWYPSADREIHLFSYDANGQKSSYTDPQGRVTTYDYDVRNRLWKTNETVNTIPRTTETLYDEVGNKKLVKFPVEAAGQRTQQWLDYDPFGQPGRFIDERGNTTNMDYWNWGPMKKLFHVVTHRRLDDGSTWEDQPTTFYYDGVGRPQWTIFPDGSSELTTYLFGQVDAFKTRKDQTKRLYYDARGREVYHTWDSDAAPRIDRTWDNANRLTAIANSVATLDYQYDDAGQPKYEGTTIAGSGNYTHVNYLRYQDGNVSHMQYPNGLWVRHDYTARGQLERIYHNWGNTWSVPIEYHYNFDGKVSYKNHGSGIQTLFGYDGRGFPNMVRNFFPSSGQELTRRNYYRDERDRITSFQKGSGNPLNFMEDGRGDHYWYDPEGQLTAAYYGAVNPVTNPQSPVRFDYFGYDELGNRTGSNYVANRSAWITFTRKDNRLNQYHQWYSYVQYDDDIGDGWGSPQHANGVTMRDGNITGGYNALNQPMMIWSANNPGGQWLWFGYDPLGRCVKRWYAQADGSGAIPATYFVYDGWNVVEEGYSPWSPVRFYIQGGRVDEIVQSYNSASGLLAYHYYDASGHCTLLTDGQGSIKEQYYYDAFGYPYFYNGSGNWLDSSPHGNRFLFTGREWLSELRLYDFRNRLYNPELGRFMQPDPKQFAAGDYNLYRYCHNDPVNKSDPTGLESGSWDNSFWEGDFSLPLRGFLVFIGARTPQNYAEKQESENGVHNLLLAGEMGGPKVGTLYRLGRSTESAARLARKAAEAEAKIGIHGVSASEGALSEASTAERSEVEKHFKVHNTGNEPHRTIELPKPVTDAVARLFNKLFGRNK
jgi:RHS repeat-associated protein